MSSKIKLVLFFFSLYISLCCTIQLNSRKDMYQKDVSEYCRRRVLPSIFLSRHVTAANAEMLHFSQLEVPYSCFLSIRAESGSNIIMVLQLAYNDKLDVSCDLNQNQLVVYEMGETFGGYWGPLPDSIAMIDPHTTTTERYYTLKTSVTPKKLTVPDIPDSDSDNDSDDSSEETTTRSTTTEAPTMNTDENYVQFEIPLVNVTGRLVNVGKNFRPETSFDVDDTFDMIYNVQPKPGEKYESSEMPLVQFSREPPKFYENRRKGDGEEEDTGEPMFNFEIDYGLEGITQDPRLRLPDLLKFLSPKKQVPKKYKYDPNRKSPFLKHRSTKGTTKSTTAVTPPQNGHLEAITKINLRTYNETIPSYLFDDDGDNINVTWQYVDELLDMLKIKDKSRSREILQFKNSSTLLQKIADAHHNSSAYLVPDLSGFNSQTLDVERLHNLETTIRELSTRTRTNFQTSSEDSKVTNEKRGQSESSKITYDPKPSTQHMSTRWNSVRTVQKTNNPQTTSGKISSAVTGEMKPKNEQHHKSHTVMKEKPHIFPTHTSPPSTVDHKSFENVVQAAPFLVGLFNNTDSEQKHRTPHTKNNKSLVRKKRKVKSIEIKGAMPHHMSTEENTFKPSESLYLFSDIQDFAQLVEVADDELYGHIAMRYLAKYVGTPLFNICDYRDSQTRHVHLLNSSRIVIAINQFTMKRMTLVTTPARTLLAPDARCPPDNIECQVSGARVCIDSMVACDGVPNCGSYDIYDEDRLTCGALIGLQHNVYLTAFTFLAVLLTLLYIGHYWIKRCVPKVSDAFFVYRNGCENILYLDTIMRSPSAEENSSSKMLFSGEIFEDVMISDEDIIIKNSKQKKQSVFKRLMGFCFRRKKPPEPEISHISQSETQGQSRRVYSFAEEELFKMTFLGKLDACVQTGDSLEMQRQPSRMPAKKKSIDLRFQVKNEHEHKRSPSRQRLHSTILPTRDLNSSILRIPSEKGTIRSISRLPTMTPRKESLASKDTNSSQRDSISGELNILKFFRDVRSASVSYNPNDKNKTDTPFYSPRKVEKQDIGTNYEKEIANVDYNVYSPTHSDKDYLHGQMSHADSSRKRLRFDETYKTIPRGETDDENAGPSTTEGIEVAEEDSPEHGALLEFKRFWGNKFGNKTKGKPVPRRPSHL